MRAALESMAASPLGCAPAEGNRRPVPLIGAGKPPVLAAGLEPEMSFDGEIEIVRLLTMHAAWKHYFLRSAGSANGTSAPLDKIFSQILNGNDHDNAITERDWYVATTVVQWLATNVGQCVLFDAGYEYKSKDDEEVAK